MCDLWTPLKKAHPAINQEFSPHLDQLLNPIDPLEPNQLQHPRMIPDLGNQPPGPLVTQTVYTGYPARHLDVFRRRPYLPDKVDLRPVQMPVWEKLQQVLEYEYAKLFF